MRARLENNTSNPSEKQGRESLMRTGHRKILKCALWFACLAGLVEVNLIAAQTPGGTLRGQVTDPSGAAVGGATVLLTTPTGAAMDTTSNKDGLYEFKELAPGKYEIKAVAQGFALFTKSDAVVTAGQVTRMNIPLTLEVQQEKVEVNSTTTQVDVNPASNANTIVMQGKDLEALSDDPDELQSELQALAGPSAGPNGGQIYIDGFTAGQLPPKASIREIRINQNPFSSEYDKLGYGRVEIFTKPGTDKLHGQVMFSGNSSAFNSRSPFEILPAGTAPPDYHTTFFSGNVGGALNKKTSYFFNLERRDIQNLGVVSATILDPSFNIVPFSAAVANPETRTNLSPRIDFQLTPSNTLTARYQYFRNTETNSTVGQFNLEAVGTKDLSTEHTLQVSDTQVIGSHMINESRFQYVHDETGTTPLITATTVNVRDDFAGNGAGGGNTSDLQNRYEFQNTTYLNYGKHAWKFGVRIRDTRDVNATLSNYNGQFFFNNIQQYQTFLEGLGGAPSYYTQTGGKSSFEVNWVDAGLFVQDDWKLRTNVTVSYGLRFETQNGFSDKADFAPRLGVAWGIGGNAKKSPKTVLRAGFGMFYDRFTYNQILQQDRLGGTDPQNYQVRIQVMNPNFYLSGVPLPISQLPPTTTPTIYQTNPNLHAPYTIQTGVTLERQLTKSANVAVTYLNSRGVHQFYTNNINPFDPITGQRPNDISENVLQYQSEGIFKQRQLIVNGSVRMGAKLSLFGYYTLNYSNSDTAGPGSFPSNPYDLQQDYGRASFDIRNRLFIGGTIGLPRGFRLSPFLVASSGIPFNITTGTDPYQGNVYNVRPEFGACASGQSTKYGCFVIPTPAEFPAYTPIPINFAESPGRFALNVRLSKTFGFGPALEGAGNAGGVGGTGGGTFGRGPGGPGRGGPGGRGMDAGATNRRYGLTFSVNARNVFNNVNLGTPIGNLQSLQFGESNSLANGPYNGGTANRRIDLQVSFSF
ncbi:MAG: TonB-dependent receptor [Candidatus Acidiferrum sp.]